PWSKDDPGNRSGAASQSGSAGNVMNSRFSGLGKRIVRHMPMMPPPGVVGKLSADLLRPSLWHKLVRQCIGHNANLRRELERRLAAARIGKFDKIGSPSFVRL